ncbi:MAG: DUF4238 domain-containing protein [Microbacterium sp.]|uniref:DUF4238 domain-containing protein n=1 Tax=Microbacterium sp. TaxID=51671 RepID=UPI002723C4B9|nr:DUF4238 domain-containing protein [Microbacterium sp.]MDO8383360.1 DUF4238 domain-containing protein [Microbacterium sp.]
MYQPASEAGAARLAQEWYESLDTKSKVGTRHHIVPRMILRRFANSAGQIRIRDRFTGKLRLVSVGDVAVKNFYTFVDLDMLPNGAMEIWLSEVEAEFARVARPYLSSAAFGRAPALTGMDRFAVDTFVAVQALRGMRTRRSMELVADYSIKMVNQDKLSPAEIRDIEIVPHQNEHIEFMHRASEQLADHLSQRPVAVVRLDEKLLVISDEPVVLAPRDGVPKGDMRKRLRVDGERVPPANLVQVASGLGVGFYDADEVIFPLSPRYALVYGEIHSLSSRPPTWDLQGREAIRVAREVNRLQARNAFSWVAAHPDGPHLAQIPWPAATPAVIIYDDYSAPAAVVNAHPHARPHRSN